MGDIDHSRIAPISLLSNKTIKWAWPAGSQHSQRTTLHRTHHEYFSSQRRLEKRDWAIANKKKIRDSTISREDIDDAIANCIKLAFKEQQNTLDSVVTSAVRDVVDSMLIPALRELCEDIQATNNSVKEPREEFEVIATAAKQTRDRVDSVQAAAREDRRAVMDLRNQLERLTEKMTDMEDKSRRNNVRLVGLPEGVEGSNVAGFLRVNLSKWIPSLKGRNIEIDRAHRVYDVEVFSGPKIRARPESTRITSYPNPTCINNNKKKINPTRDRPDEIRPESEPTRPHLFFNPTGPERKRHWRVHSLQPHIGPEKSRGPADLAAAPLLSFSLFTY